MMKAKYCLPVIALMLWQAERVLAQSAAVEPVKIVIPVIPPMPEAACQPASTPTPPPPVPVAMPSPTVAPVRLEQTSAPVVPAQYAVQPVQQAVPAQYLAPSMLPPPPAIRQTAYADEAPGDVHARVELPFPEPGGAPPDEERLGTEPAERWWTMRELQGTWIGKVMDDHRLSLYGWTEASYNASTNDVSNSPVVWNDRSNRFLLQQHWIRFERSVVTDTNDPTWGFRIDTLIGSDYRFSIPRGLLNGQLANADGTTQNLYGVDLIQHYVNVYFPNMFKGTEFRVGRLWTPWGMESLEGPATPLPSRSYAFNWCPPFTHWGLGAYVTFSDKWSGVFMLVNGNDIYLGSSAEEMRTVGNLSCKCSSKDTVTFAWGLGRGMFNAGAPFPTVTVALPTEPLGRNNFNNVDLVWQHVFNEKWSYAVEGVYGWQYSAPDVFNPSGFGTATWGSVCQYLFYQITPKLQSVTRVEAFDDAVGQRTGFPGLYTAVTTGLRWNITKSILFRPELRYDYFNGPAALGLPFEGKRDIFVADADLIVRW